MRCFVGFPQASGQHRKMLIDFGVLSGKLLEGGLADKLEFAIGYSNDRRRPRQSVDDGEVADDCTRTQNCKYPLLPLGRVEQTLSKPLSSR